jgi:Lrp/AsnC family transcriptional regulator, leucine-responsive regulatory protein
MLDATDRRILSLLQANARIANAELARELDMAPSAVLERTRKLEQRGIVQGHEARLNAKAIGLGLTAFVFVRAEETTSAMTAGEALRAIPEVQEVHNVAGEDCYLVKLRARDTEDLGRLLRERFASIPAVRNTRTTIVLSTLKETSQLPLDRIELRSS